MKSKIILKDQGIEYFLNRKRIKNIYIRLDHNLNLVVNAPRIISLETISKFVIDSYPKLSRRKAKLSNKKIEPPFTDTEILIFSKKVPREKDIDKQLKKALSYYLDENYENICQIMDIKKIPLIKLTRVKTYLGQYNKRKNLVSLNILIAHLDKAVIEYILIHELSHIKHLNHQQDFWNYVEKYCKNYNELRKIAKKEFVYYEKN